MKHLRCTVLSADMVPIANISAERALVMTMLDKAWVLENYKNEVFRSVNQSFPAPAVVVVNRYVPLPAHFYGSARLTTINLKRRDRYTCQYCGRRGKEFEDGEFWTRDHILPVSRGGEDLWENVVLACNTCNNKKGDRTPEEAGMELLVQPREPTRWQLENLVQERRKKRERQQAA